MKKGFTLIELLIVIAIIGAMATIAVIGLSGAQAKARDARRKSDLENVRAALELYRSDCDRYPQSGNGTGMFTFSGPANFTLTGTSGTPGARCSNSNVYLKSVPKDPKASGPAYLYSVNGSGTTYSLCSTLEQHNGMSTVSCGSSQCGTAGNNCYYQTVNP